MEISSFEDNLSQRNNKRSPVFLIHLQVTSIQIYPKATEPYYALLKLRNLSIYAVSQVFLEIIDHDQKTALAEALTTALTTRDQVASCTLSDLK